jgi:hypothetical protein
MADPYQAPSWPGSERSHGPGLALGPTPTISLDFGTRRDFHRRAAEAVYASIGYRSIAIGLDQQQPATVVSRRDVGAARYSCAMPRAGCRGTISKPGRSWESCPLRTAKFRSGAHISQCIADRLPGHVRHRLSQNPAADIVGGRQRRHGHRRIAHGNRHRS